MKTTSRLCLLLSAIFFVALPSWGAADEAVTSKMLALFGQFDADHNASLSAEEQVLALDSVKKNYGGKWAVTIQKMFIHAAAADHSVSEESWKKEVASYDSIPQKQTVKIAMRDGVHLATDIYLPSGTGPFPVVFSRTPYGRTSQGNDGGGLVRNGFAYIVQDMRGRFDSEGENFPFIGCGWGEHQDGVDTIAWIRQQPWSDGSVGTIGGSAGGITQNLLAGAAPQGLKAQYISVATTSLYSDATYTGGAFRKVDSENWTTQNKFDPRAAEIFHTHPSYDDYWKQFDTSLKFEAMNVPAVFLGGWFDIFTQGVLDEFVGRQHHGAPGSRGTQKLVMGPFTHSLGRMPVGELTFPNSKIPGQYGAFRWLDHYLRGTDNGIEKEPAVTYYVMGDTSTPGAPGDEWRHADDWPIPATETAFFFSREGKLATEKPSDNSAAPVEYIFDPSHPCPTVGGNNLTIDRGPMNQNRIENRSDVTLFTTAPLTEPIEVTGRIKAKVFVSSSAKDTDLSVRLCDVYPDGKSYLIAEGMLRLRYRKSLEQPEPLTPGQVEEVTVDCWSTSIVFNKGHRIRATVTSSNYPRFDLNPGTGAQWSDNGEKVPQTNHIFCDGGHASHLLLPVVTKANVARASAP